MSYIGDFRLGDTFDTKFTTRQISGAPSTLGSSPVISAYVGNNTTEITAGITLSVDFDSRTGLNNVRVVASGGNGFATASNYQLVITTGTVNSVSVVGEVIAEFSIENRSALMPTTAAATLDVNANGEAGLDWGNVGNKTTTNALTNTSIITTQKVDVDTIKTNPVVNAGTITFPTTATLASTTNITAGTITTVGTLTTYTGNIPQTGDSFARIGATGSGLTSLAPSATALSTAVWTSARAGYLDNINNSALATLTIAAIIGTAVDGTITMAQSFKISNAAAGSKASGLGTVTAVFRNPDDSKDRITATVDAVGNRTAVTYDFT